MVHITRILAFFLLVPDVIAMHASRHNNVPQASILANATKPKAMRTFSSKDKLWCGEAEEHIAEDALKLYKSMPRGKFYEGATMSKKSCKKLGYVVEMGEDPCYPGLKTFYRSEEDKKKFIEDFFDNLDKFGKQKNLTVNDTAQLDACNCKDGSFAKKYWGDTCKRADKGKAMVEKLVRKRMRTFVSTNKFWCGQAAVNVAENSLKLFKSMPRGKLYEDIAISGGQTCKELGYNVESGEDPCYPRLQTYFRNKKDKDKFQTDFYATLDAFGELNNIQYNDTIMLDACSCKDGSPAQKYWGDSCKRADQLRLTSTQ